LVIPLEERRVARTSCVGLLEGRPGAAQRDEEVEPTLLQAVCTQPERRPPSADSRTLAPGELAGLTSR
jgi:hypothetical protein